MVFYHTFGRVGHLVIVIIVTNKNEEDLIKLEDAGLATTLKIDFSNIQGQLTPHIRVEPGSN